MLKRLLMLTLFAAVLVPAVGCGHRRCCSSSSSSLAPPPLPDERCDRCNR